MTMVEIPYWYFFFILAAYLVGKFITYSVYAQKWCANVEWAARRLIEFNDSKDKYEEEEVILKHYRYYIIFEQQAILAAHKIPKWCRESFLTSAEASYAKAMIAESDRRKNNNAQT